MWPRRGGLYRSLNSSASVTAESAGNAARQCRSDMEIDHGGKNAQVDGHCDTDAVSVRRGCTGVQSQ